MPTRRQRIDYDLDIAHGPGRELELELHDDLGGRPGTIACSGYINHAKMGRYADAIPAVQVPRSRRHQRRASAPQSERRARMTPSRARWRPRCAA